MLIFLHQQHFELSLKHHFENIVNIYIIWYRAYDRYRDREFACVFSFLFNNMICCRYHRYWYFWFEQKIKKYKIKINCRLGSWLNTDNRSHSHISNKYQKSFTSTWANIYNNSSPKKNENKIVDEIINGRWQRFSRWFFFFFSSFLFTLCILFALRSTVHWDQII